MAFASRPSLRQSLGPPTRIDLPLGTTQKKSAKLSTGLGLGAGGGRPSSVTAGNRRRTQVLSKGSRPSSVGVGQGKLANDHATTITMKT